MHEPLVDALLVKLMEARDGLHKDHSIVFDGIDVGLKTDSAHFSLDVVGLTLNVRSLDLMDRHRLNDAKIGLLQVSNTVWLSDVPLLVLTVD